jgi:hypothetical protein
MAQQSAAVGSTARDQLSHLVTADLEKYLALSKAKIRALEATDHLKECFNRGTSRTTQNSKHIF